jgi:hypothetical protein
MFCLLFTTLFVSCEDRSSTHFTKSPASTDQKGSRLTPDSAAKPGSEITPVKESNLILKPGDRLNIDDVINNNDGTFNITFSCKGVHKMVTVKVLEFSNLKNTTTDDGTPFGEMESTNGGVLRVYITITSTQYYYTFAITAGEPSGNNIFLGLNSIKSKDEGIFLEIMSHGVRSGVKSFQIDNGDNKDCYFQYSNIVRIV